jgi:hypothetical protein
MRLNARSRRRILAASAIAGTAIACFALSCAGLGRPAAALAGLTAPAAGTAAAQCGPASTTVWLGLNPDGAALSTIFYPVEFTNTGSRSCWLAGPPQVSGFGRSGRRIGPAALRHGARHRVTLAPGRTAHALLGVAISGFVRGCHAATGAGLDVMPPGQHDNHPIDSFTFPACTNKRYLNVSAITAGVGIP